MEEFRTSMEEFRTSMEEFRTSTEEVRTSMEEFRTSMEEFRSVTEERLDRLEVSVGQLKGGYFESKWKENGTAYLGSQNFRKARYIDKNILANLLDEAVENGVLDEELESDVLLIDAVHGAVKKGTLESVYIATEVSSRVHATDVERAIRRAKSLELATVTTTVACVAGASIDELAKALADRNKVIVIEPSEWDANQVA